MQSCTEVLQILEMFVYLHSRCTEKLSRMALDLRSRRSDSGDFEGSELV